MLRWTVLCAMTIGFYSERAWGQGECTDLRGRLIAHGLHYVPGPDTCTLCVCDNGLPKVCKAVLCSPPQDCRSFRVGNTCCEFICLDDVVKPAEGAEGSVRLAAGGAAAAVLLTVALVVYRVRRQKRRRTPHADDQRSLTSIGYISGSMGYMGGSCETALAAWKPGGPYLPRGEAPPPYDEVVAQCRSDALGRPTEAYHRSYPATVEPLRPDDPLPCQGHSYANVPRPLPQMANPASCYNAPLLQPAPAHEPREPLPMPHHPLAPNMVGYPAYRLTGSLGAISNRGLLSVLARSPPPPAAPPPPPPPAPEPRDTLAEHPERPHNVPGFYAATQHHAALHRTIPRMPLEGALPLDGALGFARERSLQAARRSFHRASERRDARDAATGRSMPRNLNIVTAADHHTPNIRISASGVSNAATNTGSGGPGRRDEPDGSECARPAALAPASAPAPGTAPKGKPPPPAPCPPNQTLPHQTLPLTVDKPSCVCSYAGDGGAGGAAGGGAGAGAGRGAGAEGEDDYRSECENCKAASNSRWAVSEGWASETEDGTQTLQRRAPPPLAPPPATATLPQPVSKPRTLAGPPSNWENWFNTIPDSDTESEEE